MAMAKLHSVRMCATAWSADMRACGARFDSTTASPLRLSLRISSSLAAGRCWYVSSARSRQLCGISAALEIPEYYHIPYTEGVPVGSKLKLFNLPSNYEEEALIEHFRSCGAVVKSLEITNNASEEGIASGYVVVEDLDQACIAVAQLDGERFEGKCLRMDFVERLPCGIRNPSRSRIKRKPTLLASNRVYIGNLPWRVDNATLQQLFSAHGTVHEAQVVREKLNGRSRGYGFVVMSSAVEVKKAIAALDGCEVEGRPLKVNVAMKHAPLQIPV